MNMIEKIMAKRSGRRKVVPGDVVVCEVDCALLHDLSARSCRIVWEKQVGGKMLHPERIVTVIDATIKICAVAENVAAVQIDQNVTCHINLR